MALGVASVTMILTILKQINLKKKGRITLQDPEAEYPLPLIEKEVMGHLNFPLVR